MVDIVEIATEDIAEMVVIGLLQVHMAIHMTVVVHTHEAIVIDIMFGDIIAGQKQKIR